MHCPMWCCRSGPIFGLTGSTPVSAIHAYTSSQFCHSIFKSIKLECERAPQGRASISSRPSRESENQPSSIEHPKFSPASPYPHRKQHNPPRHPIWNRVRNIADRFIFLRAQIVSPPQTIVKSHHRRILNHCMVKNIYNAKQNRTGIGAILIQQKSSTKTLIISHNSYTNCSDAAQSTDLTDHQKSLLLQAELAKFNKFCQSVR